jgi:hypothetical protein
LFLEYRDICTVVLFFSAKPSSISIVSTGAQGRSMQTPKYGSRVPAMSNLLSVAVKYVRC